MSQCKYCKKESNGHPFCKECGKKYFNFIPEDEYVLSKSEPVKEEKQTINNDIPKYVIIEIPNRNTIQTEYHHRTNHIYTSYTPDTITRCAICQRNSNGYTYCWDCYQRLKSHKNQENKEESKGYMSYDGKYQLRSKSEKAIYDFLTRKGFKCEYERPFKCENGMIIRPDFYIKGPYIFNGRLISNIYIEHWGGLSWNDPIKRQKYKEDRINKIQQYRKSGITLISTYESDMENCEEAITKKLKEYIKGEVNY